MRRRVAAVVATVLGALALVAAPVLFLLAIATLGFNESADPDKEHVGHVMLDGAFVSGGLGTVLLIVGIVGLVMTSRPSDR